MSVRPVAADWGPTVGRPARRSFSARIALLLLGAAGLVGGWAVLAGARPALAQESGAEKLRVYFGTYTGSRSKGIYQGELELKSGQLRVTGLAATTTSPSFLALHPSGRFLYAVNEVDRFNGKPGGSVSAFAVDPQSGALTLLNQEATRGAHPCHLIVDREGKNVLVANYTGGSVAVLPIAPDGRLGLATGFVQHTGSSVNRDRQKEPHAHCMTLDAVGSFAFAADLGLDKVLIYRYDAAAGTLTPNDPPAGVTPPGSGPRHFVFHRNGRTGYVINELTSTVTTFRYTAATGALEPLQTLSTLPADFTRTNSTAEVMVHPSGKFLYGSNRGHNSIAIFTIDPETGLLTAAGHEPTQGRTPRNFTIDPTGTYLLAANQESNNVVVFRIDPATGRLTVTGPPVEVFTPVCVEVVPPAR
jgi:6-phosphogluconolactonase